MVNILVAKPVRTQTMGFVTGDGFTGSMHSTPEQFSYSDVPNFGTTPREGRKAITRMESPGLRTLAFTQVVASLDYQQSIQSVIQRFTNTCARGTRVRFTGGSGPFEQPCWWLITGLDVDVTQRALNNEPSRATLSWTLVEWLDVTAVVSKPKPKPKVPAAPPRPVAAPARTYRVVSGDMLWTIAMRFLGRGERWPEIYNLNRGVIGGNPNLIFPGQLFKIPG